MGACSCWTGSSKFSWLNQAIYHEMLVHPILAGHGKVEDILVIGGGDGGTIRECLRHQPHRIVMVDLDPGVIALCRRYLPEMSMGAFDDPRVCLVHEDGAAYVAHSPAGSFDAVIVDGGDYTGLSEVLFSATFFGDIARVLRPGGVVAVQAGSVLDAHLIRTGRERLRAVFADVTAYRLTMPSYHCGEYCFLAAALAPILSHPDAGRLSQVEATLRSRFTPTYWSPAVQRAAQCCPRRFHRRHYASRHHRRGPGGASRPRSSRRVAPPSRCSRRVIVLGGGSGPPGHTQGSPMRREGNGSTTTTCRNPASARGHGVPGAARTHAGWVGGPGGRARFPIRPVGRCARRGDRAGRDRQRPLPRPAGHGLGGP